MFLLAPLWSVLLINLGFVAMFFEARSGALPRWALVFPVLYFGGYYAVAIYQHLAVNHTIETASAPVSHLKFDPDNTAIESDYGNEEVSHDLLVFCGVARAIEPIYGHDLALVFKRDPSCSAAPASRFSTNLGEMPRHSLTMDRCIVKTRESYNGPVLKISSPYRPGTAEGSSEIIVTASDGSQATIENGSYPALSWFPMPMIGCALQDSPSAWVCDAAFARTRIPMLQPKDGVTGPAIAVANVLGLTRQPL
ncbi:hypothetical protein [Rhizobium sp. L43]|uniref:hypothetical protein n=1 Tax=Rhizobium sp. L43 TaxID=2035452 RepID=UPI00117A2D1B|nr:hypothetical protein [Rhizobium sp. L43]